ncbi:MAG: hypothetical protein FRX49_08261 [Trebouxia sp. A1-2]|nr:MAG: hypothetical protein FRX49_08261 [Trebouxia sp. A1-2]
MGCKTGQAVTLRPSLHFLPTQVLYHITGHHTHHHLITGKSTRIAQQRELLRVACGYSLWQKGGLGKDRVMWVSKACSGSYAASSLLLKGPAATTMDKPFTPAFMRRFHCRQNDTRWSAHAAYLGLIIKMEMGIQSRKHLAFLHQQ